MRPHSSKWLLSLLMALSTLSALVAWRISSQCCSNDFDLNHNHDAATQWEPLIYRSMVIVTPTFHDRQNRTIPWLRQQWTRIQQGACWWRITWCVMVDVGYEAHSEEFTRQLKAWATSLHRDGKSVPWKHRGDALEEWTKWVRDSAREPIRVTLMDFELSDREVVVEQQKYSTILGASGASNVASAGRNVAQDLVDGDFYYSLDADNTVQCDFFQDTARLTDDPDAEMLLMGQERIEKVMPYLDPWDVRQNHIDTAQLLVSRKALRRKHTQWGTFGTAVDGEFIERINEQVLDANPQGRVVTGKTLAYHNGLLNGLSTGTCPPTPCQNQQLN